MKITTAWMLWVALLLFINYTSCDSRDMKPADKVRLDEETDQIFAELQKQLDELETLKNDERTKKAVTDGAEDSKNAIKKLDDANHIMKALDAVKGIGPGLAKFKTGDPYDIAEGAFAIIASVTAVIPLPVGPALSAIASVISAIIPLFKPATKDKQIIAGLLKNILREENDKLLKSEVNGFKEELETALATISQTTEFISDVSLDHSVSRIPSTFGANILGKVGKRIQDRAGDNTNSGGKGAYDLAIAFAQLATYRDVGLIKMMTVLLKSEREKEKSGLAAQYRLALEHNRYTVYQRYLSFFHNPSLAVAQTMVHYYPPGHNNRSKFLYSFIKANGINEPETVPTGHYVIKSKYWPAYYLRRSLSSATFPHGRIVYSVSYNWDTPTTYDKILVTRNNNGYYSLELVDPRFSTDKSYRHPFYTYVSIASSDQYVQVSANYSSFYGNFVIIKYMVRNGIVVTIAENGTATRVWNGLRNKWAVYPAELTKSNKDKAPFILLTCKAPEEGSKCPDWN